MSPIITEQLTREKNVRYVFTQHLCSNCFLSKTCALNQETVHIFAETEEVNSITFSFIALISLY